MLHVFTMTYNEARMLPHFLRHYARFGARIALCDNHSTDGTAELAAARGCDVTRFDSSDRLDERALIAVRDAGWRRAIGLDGWAVVVDADEFLWHDDLPRFLSRAADVGYDVCVPSGFQMQTEHFPDYDLPLAEACPLGVPDERYSKPIALNLRTVCDVAFAAGGHRARFKVRDPDGGSAAGGDREPRILRSANLKLLHYKRLGLPYYLDKVGSCRARVPPEDFAEGLQTHLQISAEQAAAEFDAARPKLKNVIF